MSAFAASLLYILVWVSEVVTDVCVTRIEHWPRRFRLCLTPPTHGTVRYGTETCPISSPRDLLGGGIQSHARGFYDIA